VDASWATYYFAISLIGFVLSIFVKNLFAVILMACFLFTSIFQVIESRYMPGLGKKVGSAFRGHKEESNGELNDQNK
jgi:hypothetical protein